MKIADLAIKNMSVNIANAVDLGKYKSESFDVVTCLGPMYHLTEEEDRIKCLQESMMVLKKGGILAIAYINKHYIINAVETNCKEFLNHSFIDKIVNTGVNKDSGEGWFWTVAYFTSPSEIEAFIEQFDIEIIDHVAVDGISSIV